MNPDGRSGRTATAFLSVKGVITTTVVVVVGFLAIVPLGYLLKGTLWDGGPTVKFFKHAYSADNIGSMLVNTVVFSVGSMVVGVVCGAVLAYLVVRTDVPLKGWGVIAGLIPLIIPGILVTISWTFLASPRTGILNLALKPLFGPATLNIYSIPGMIFIQGLNVAPLAFLLMYASFRSMDPSLEEAALAGGARIRTVIRRITIPLVRPGLYAAILILLVRGVEGFEVPAIIGIHSGIWVVTSRIWYSLNQFPADYASAGAYSLTLLVIASVILYFYTRMSRSARRLQTITGKGFRPRPIELGRWRYAGGAFIVVYFALTVALPLLVLLYVSTQKFYVPPSRHSLDLLTLDHYRTVFSQDKALTALRNSVLLAVTSSTVVMLITSVAAWIVIRSRVRFKWIVDTLTFVPLMIPGLVLGVALLFVYLRSPVPVYGTLWILFIAYLTITLPYGMRYVSTSMYQISSELEESAQASGATWLQVFRRIVLPLLVPGFLAGWVFSAILTFRELSASILLYSPGHEVLAVAIWEYWQDGVMGPLSALGLVMVAVLAVIVFLARRISSEFGLRQ